MRIGIFGKSLSVDGAIYLQQFFDKLKNVNCSLIIFAPYFEQIKNKVAIHCPIHTFSSHKELHNQADLLFSIGGDGTMLDTIAYVRDSGIPILGINLGRLGFLSSISRNEILPAIDHIISGNYQLEQRTLLKLSSPSNLFGELNYALNELSITKTDTNSLAVVSVYVNDRFLNTYWADGLIVATPTGSTAYSLSCYGPIITPGSENFVITPIASHNLTVRPIVIPDNQEIHLKVGGRNAFYQLGLDSRYLTISNTVELTIQRAGFKVNLIQLPQKDFFSTIREKLLWGKDQRN
jgi:NAD+ kinase